MLDSAPLPEAYESVSALGSAVRFEMSGEPVWPATIAIPVDVSLVEGNDVLLVYYNESLDGWVPGAVAQLDRQNGIATAEVHHLTPFTPVVCASCSVLSQTSLLLPIADYVREYWDDSVDWLREEWNDRKFLLSEVPRLAREALELLQESGGQSLPWVKAILGAAASLANPFSRWNPFDSWRLLSHHGAMLLDLLKREFGYDIDPPTCERSIPDWANPTELHPSKDVLLHCDQSATVTSESDSTDLGLKLTVNRTYGLVLDPPRNVAVTADPSPTSINVESTQMPSDLEDILGYFLHEWSDDGIYLAPGTTTELRIPKSVRG